MATEMRAMTRVETPRGAADFHSSANVGAYASTPSTSRGAFSKMLGMTFLGRCERENPPVIRGPHSNVGGSNVGGSSSAGTRGGSVESGGGGGMGGAMNAGCSTDGDCAGDPTGNVCDPNTHSCVQCTPQNDPCASGQFCHSTTNQCKVGCTRSDASVPAARRPRSDFRGVLLRLRSSGPVFLWFVRRFDDDFLAVE